MHMCYFGILLLLLALLLPTACEGGGVMIVGSMHYQVDQHSAFHPMVEEPLPAVPMMHAPIQPVQVHMQPVQATAAADVRTVQMQPVQVQMQPVQATAALATYKGEVTDCYCCSNKSSRATFFKDSIVLDTPQHRTKCTFRRRGFAR